MKSLMNAVFCPRFLAPAILLSFVQPSFGGPKVTIDRHVAAAETVSMDQIDHRLWDALLNRYVDDDGDVAYAAWKSAAQDVQALDAYLATLSTGDLRRQAGKSAVLAFWINAYNAVTVRGILREYPTSSIRNHSAKLFGYNIWKDLLLLVGGQPYSLDQIEHEILRKLEEPRIHFTGDRQFQPRRVLGVQPAIVNPPTLPAREVRDQVVDNELVLGVVIAGQARAYPINMLTGPRREIVNDTLGGRAIAATW